MNLDDFQCKCGSCPKVLPDERLSEIIEDIEHHFGVAVEITSGMRCKEYNATIPGASSGSFHAQGKAVDCYMPGVLLSDIYNYVSHEWLCGLHEYSTHLHIDSRPYAGRW
jgi:uncharacterized protein YcbK (DUF882 family)